MKLIPSVDKVVLKRKEECGEIYTVEKNSVGIIVSDYNKEFTVNDEVVFDDEGCFEHEGYLIVERNKIWAKIEN